MTSGNERSVCDFFRRHGSWMGDFFFKGMSDQLCLAASLMDSRGFSEATLATDEPRAQPSRGSEEEVLRPEEEGDDSTGLVRSGRGFRVFFCGSKLLGTPKNPIGKKKE